MVTTGLVTGWGDLKVNPGDFSGGRWARSGKALGRAATGALLTAVGYGLVLFMVLRLTVVAIGGLGAVVATFAIKL